MALGQRGKHQSEMFVQESAGQGGIEFGIDVCSQSINDIAAAFILLQTLLFASSFRLSVFQFRVLGGKFSIRLRKLSKVWTKQTFIFRIFIFEGSCVKVAGWFLSFL